MSITSDIRGYADTAIEQGKQVVGQAQAQFNDLTGTARTNVSELTNRAAGTVTDLRTQAEKTLNIDAIRAAVEPYLAQARQYRASVSDRAESVFGSVYGTVKTDPRVARVVETAESLTSVVVDTVAERVVKPVASLTGRGKPAAKKPAARRATAQKPAATRPAAKKATATKSTAAKTAAAKKTAAKKAAPGSNAGS